MERSTQYTSFSSRKQPANAGIIENAHVALQQTVLTHAHTKCFLLHQVASICTKLHQLICFTFKTTILLSASASHMELHSNNCDISIFSETWLKSNFPSHLICPEDFSVLRRDRINRPGGGVAIICRSGWLLEQLDSAFFNTFECLCAKIATPNSTFYVAAVYHISDPQHCPDELLEHLTNSCNRLLTGNPNSNLIISVISISLITKIFLHS